VLRPDGNDWFSVRCTETVSSTQYP
jgi:hypothetical protein